MKYGIDQYSRYVSENCDCALDGYDCMNCERIAIEPYPWFHLWPVWEIPRQCYYKLTARIAMLDWHRGMIRQHGVREWLRYRKY